MKLNTIRRIAIPVAMRTAIPVAAVAGLASCYIILTHQSAEQKAAEAEAFKNHLVIVSDEWARGLAHTACKIKTQRLLHRENLTAQPVQLRSDYVCASGDVFFGISCNNDSKTCDYNKVVTQEIRTKVADFVAKQALELK